MRKLFPLILIICMAGAWFSIVYRNVNLPAEYENVLASAYDSYEKGYYLEAQQHLNEAGRLQDISDDYQAQALQRDIYYGMKNQKAYEKQVLSMIQAYPEKEENYEKLILYFQETGDTKSLCRYLPACLERLPDNEILKYADEELSKQYRYVRVGYYDVKYASKSLVSIQQSEYETLEDDGKNVKRKLVDSSGSTVFDAGYAQMSVSQDERSYFVCDKDGAWTRIDTARNLLARNQDVSFSDIGSLAANNIATAVIDGKYHFINEKMQISDIFWEEAGTFYNDINAVKQNGAWAFVTSATWPDVIAFPYTDIPRNSLDYCVVDGYAVAADAGGYHVVNTQDFLPVSNNVYEEIKAFESTEPTAYRKGNQWGFVDNQGEIYIEACYEDAKPFVNGYAPVKQDGLWGYINQKGMMVIEPQFQDALGVLGSGYAYVQEETGYWSYIVIDRLYYTD